MARLGRNEGDWVIGVTYWFFVMSLAALLARADEKPIKLRVSPKIVLVGNAVTVHVTTTGNPITGSVRFSYDCGYNGAQGGSTWDTDSVTDTHLRTFVPSPGTCWVRATLTRDGKTYNAEERIEVKGGDM